MYTSLKTLEFDKIMDKLHQYASCSLGKEAIRDIKISNNIDSIQQLLDETEEALNLLYRIGEIPFGGITDISAYVKRASIGGVLAISDLVRITDFIYGVYQIKNYLAKIKDQKVKCEVISEYINRLINLNDLRKEIEICVDMNGNLADDASPKLKEVRNKIKVMEARVKDKMHSILNSMKDYLSDSIITIRNDRYVIPVRVEYKNKVQGIIHDTSQSGNTVFIEPKIVVDMNNKISSLIHDEKEEINKILRKLTEKVAEFEVELLDNTKNVKILDFIFAKAKYARDIQATKPIINNNGVIKILKGRHPLISSDEVVPNDIYIGEEFTAIVITGPNTGGKTVTLKTVGIFSLMMQAGLLIPANDQSELAIFDNIFADIGDEQSIEQSLSTFSSHMKNIISIVKHISLNSLVLFDELGAGTDPKEGAALAMSILDYFHDRGARTIATTHYSELKTYAYNRDNVMNASVEFDVETLRPTYKLLIGIPGRSNALEISKRLGLTDKIIVKAKAKLETEQTDVANLITQLENQGLYLDRLINENEALKQNLDKEKGLYEKNNHKLENQKEKLISKAKEEAVLIVQKAEKEVSQIIDELKELKKNQKANYKEHEVIDIRNKLDTKKYYGNKNLKESKTYKELKPGDLVNVLTLNRQGELIEKVNNTEWLVQIGILTSRVNQIHLELLEDKNVKNKSGVKSQNKIRIKKSMENLLEIDLRGERYEDALIKLDKYIDSAMLNNYHQVSIIHGHGTGVLRKAVQKYLKKCQYVESFRFGKDGEGGVGVTVATFK